MSRTCIPFSAGDVSALARSLRSQLTTLARTPSHLELLNMLARGAGHRNFQSLRAQETARHHLERPQPATEPVDLEQVLRVARHFDSGGRLATWPAKRAFQITCLWVLWSRLPAREPLTEEQLNCHLRADHLFSDHALLRRELCDQNLLARTPNGREYRRVERTPSAEALAVIRYLKRTTAGRRS